MWKRTRRTTGSTKKGRQGLKCVAIGGVPATGKSTLVKKIYDKMQQIDFACGLVRGHYDSKYNIALVGLYNLKSTFLGTDRLSMAVNKEFLRYASMRSTNIIFEGDRLFSLNNLNKLRQLYDLRIVMLENDNDILANRHKERNDTQSEKFLKGRVTKMKKIKEYFNNKIEVHSLKNLQDSEELSNNIYSWLKT